MNAERYRRLMELFDEACDLPAEARPAFFQAVAPEDADLVEPLRVMLAQDLRTQVFFDTRGDGGAGLLARDVLQSGLAVERQLAPGAAGAPATIGDYEILELVGAGAMGTVYRARQRDPDRVVALKTLHPWLVSARAIERFRFEAQALATLRHPGIPPVYAVGQHERLVYFAMELVGGPTLTAWGDQVRPSLRERVAMMLRICDAVHHANLRGFVHRDLKPDNIRIGDDGEPRVLDFGIAGTLGSVAHEVVGTPTYMSPEQLEPGAVDVRADVYALGVTAFELFTGRLPRAIDDASVPELRRQKRLPPPRASAIEPRVSADLDAVLARALAVAPDQRYPSAAELGADLQRYLEHRPVVARRGGVGHRARLWSRRNRVPALALTTVVSVLVAGVAVSTWQYRNAEGARRQQEAQRAIAEAERDRAAAEAARATATMDFVTEVLAEADPERGRGREVTVRTAIERAAARLAGGALANQPRVDAAVHRTVATTYIGLGDYGRADAHTDEALRIYDRAGLHDDELLAQILLLAARTRHEAGRGDAALEAGARAIATEERLHAGAPHDHVVYAQHVQAVSLREAGRIADSIALHADAVAQYRALLVRGGDDGALTDALNQAAMTLAVTGRYEEAEPLYREALARDIARVGPHHPEVATDLHHLAWLEQERGRSALGLDLLTRALAIRLATLGPDHSRIGIQRVLEAEVRLSLRDPAGAAGAIEAALANAERDFGTAHPRYTRTLQVKVSVLVDLGRAAEAVPLARTLVEAHAQRFGATHWVTASTRSSLGHALAALGRRAEARVELSAALAQLEHQLGARARLANEARARLAAIDATITERDAAQTAATGPGGAAR